MWPASSSDYPKLSESRSASTLRLGLPDTPATPASLVVRGRKMAAVRALTTLRSRAGDMQTVVDTLGRS